MQIQEIMKTEVECLSPKDTVKNAARIMRDENIGFLPVCNGDKKVLGAITDRDFVIRVLAEDKSGNIHVETVMTREVVAVRATDDVKKALELMKKHQKSRILVTDDAGRLAGVLSLSDLAQHLEDIHVASTLKSVTQREASPD
jgi:CBS domain-containing protein